MEPGQAGNLRVLRTHLIHLRPKLGEDSDNPRYIFEEPRVRYWMPEGEGESSPASPGTEATGADGGG